MSRDMEDEELMLYCDEDPFDSPPPPPLPSFPTRRGAHYAPAAVADEQELDEIFMEYKAREGSYAPTSDYLEQLQGSVDVSRARSNGLHYIIHVFGRLGLVITTAFNAANYLDRFLSMHCHLEWEDWMVELVSIASLSVASKLDGVNIIPSLHDLQMDELMKKSFRPSTIRDMELTLLKALQWRLACVTQYSFLEILLWRAPANLAARATRLLLRSLLDPSSLRFNASTIAASAFRCVADDHRESRLLSRLIFPVQHSENEDACLKMMKAHRVSSALGDDDQNPWSPVSVIPATMESAIDMRLSRCLFG